MAKKIQKHISNILLALLICFSVLYFVMNIQGIGKKNYIPGIGNYKLMSVLSGSMKPTFSPGDAIIVKNIDTETLKAGDVISFYSGEYLTTHRVKEVIKSNSQLQFKTQGDNNNVADLETVNANKIVGKYIFHIPLIGFILTYMKGPIGIALVWGLIIFIICSEIYKNSKQKKIKRISNIIRINKIRNISVRRDDIR